MSSVAVTRQAKIIERQKVLSRTLKKVRAAVGISQRELSQQAGYNRDYVMRIEKLRCQPHVFALLDIARVLGVTVDYLLTGCDGECKHTYTDFDEKGNEFCLACKKKV